MKRALITGITGQVGSYMAEFLLGKGYEVHGLVRRTSLSTKGRIDTLVESMGAEAPRVRLHQGDLTDQSSLVAALQAAQPDEVYNFAAQSFVGASWSSPVATGDVTGLGVARLLEAVRQVVPKARVYQASSSEMFGTAPSPQSLATPFHPRSPYAAAKAFAHHLAVNYRESYGLFVACGVSFNCESPRRGVEFVTRKVTKAVARIRNYLDRFGRPDEREREGLLLRMGNLDAVRDWGYAADFVEAMWRLLQLPAPTDVVLCTGTGYTVKQLVTAAFEAAGVLDWSTWVVRDPAFVRPAEVPALIGDPADARDKLGWTATTSFVRLINLMVDSDLFQGLRATALDGTGA